MSRPDASRWGVLGFDADPTPGNSDDTTGVAGVIAGRANDWLDTADRMRNLSFSGMQGLYAATYSEKLGKLPSQLYRMGNLAKDSANRLRSWGTLMEQWQAKADRVLTQAEDAVDMISRRQSALTSANEAASKSQKKYADLLFDASASVQDQHDAAARASDLSDLADKAGRDLGAAKSELETLKARAVQIRDGYRADAVSTASALNGLLDPPASAGGAASWQSLLNGLEGFGAGVLSGVVSPIAWLGDGVWNLLTASVDGQGQVDLGDSRALQDLFDQAMGWLGDHTWDPQAFWTGAQWGDGVVTVAGVVAVAAAITAATGGLDIPVSIGLAGVSGGAAVAGGTSVGVGAAGAAGAGLLGGLGIAGILNKASGGNIDKYRQRADQTPRISAEDRKKLDSWDYRPDDETYLKNKTTFDNPKYYDQNTGLRKYPENHGALEGSVENDVHLPEGTVLDRYGGEGGGYMSPKGTPFSERALPPGTDLREYHQYRVTKTGAEEMSLNRSTVKSWFDQSGGGKQYYVPQGKGEMTIDEMIHEGWIEEIK